MKPLNPVEWPNPIDRLGWNREGRMVTELRKFQCRTWTLVETIFHEYSCSQHLCLWLMIAIGHLRPEDFQ